VGDGQQRERGQGARIGAAAFATASAAGVMSSVAMPPRAKPLAMLAKVSPATIACGIAGIVTGWPGWSRLRSTPGLAAVSSCSKGASRDDWFWTRQK
jgi:hypothetical protein